MNKLYKVLIICIVLPLSLPALSQQMEYEPYAWEDNRSLTELTEEEKQFALYTIQQNEKYQYLYDSLENKFYSYVTYHEIIRVNNDEALNKSNQVYIPMQSTIELSQVKARAITPDGRIINFEEDNIKELKNEESGYKILAVEGAEVGGEIEYFYTRKTEGRNFIIKRIQSENPLKYYSFELKCPKNLEYSFKVYNHEKEVIQTDSSGLYNTYSLKLTDIPALYSEEFSSYESYRVRLEFKLSYNTGNSRSRLFTWGDAGRRVYDQIYTQSSTEQKSLEKWIKKLKFEGTPLSVFRQLEHYIKSNFSLEKDAGDQAEDIAAIIKNKYGNEKGFTRLFCAILTQLNIEHELVMTSDKSERKFDPHFESWNYLEEYIVYVKEVDQFLSPSDARFRLGTLATNFIGTDALFIRLENIQDFVFPVAHIGFIPAPDYTVNMDTMRIEVDFSKDLSSNNVKLRRSYSGYVAANYKSALLFIDEENKKEMIDEIPRLLAPDANIISNEIVDTSTAYDQWDRPFSIASQFSTPSYIESAGEVILFNVGLLIGGQTELYQEDQRTTPVDNSFNHGYLRTIDVTIPKEYQIKNPEDLVIREQVFNEEELIYNFESTYTLEGQKLQIEITEFYNQLDYPREKFEEFRKVINAAADWNKIVLVVEK